ncbi:MAG: serine/threonine-protein kinase [Myxococcaceae bacterium]
MAEQFGKYELLAKLGAGGMALTWRAQLKGAAGVVKPVVIKRILPQVAEDQAFIDAFIQEAKVTAQLSHANIAQVFDFGEQEGEYFLAMEFVQGRNLEELIERAVSAGFWHLPVPIAVLITIEVLKGLHHAHTRLGPGGQPLNLVHRDVSPDNVLVGFEGDVKLIDFGVAKAKLAGRRETEPGFVKGKYLYFSPEQATAEVELDGRSDVFAAGVMLYRMLAGRYPFEGGMTTALHQLVRGRYPPLLEVNPDLPAPVAHALEKAMKQNRDERYPNAQAFAEDLQAYLHQQLPGFAARDVGAFARFLFPEESKREGLAPDTSARFSELIDSWRPPPRPDGKQGPVPSQLSPADESSRPTMLSTRDAPVVMRETGNALLAFGETGKGWLKPLVAALGLSAAGLVGYSVWQDTRPAEPPAATAIDHRPVPRAPAQAAATPVVNTAAIPGATSAASSPAAPAAAGDDTPMTFGLGDVVVKVTPTRHRVVVHEGNDLTTFTLSAGQSVVVSSPQSRSLYFLGDANFAPVGLGELKGRLTFKGPGKVRLFELPGHPSGLAHTSNTTVDGKPLNISPQYFVQGVEGDPAEVRMLSPDAAYHLVFRGSGKAQVVMDAANTAAAAAPSVPRIIGPGVSFDLKGINRLSFAFIAGFDLDGPMEVLIGQKSGPIDGYTVDRACQKQKALEDAGDGEAAKVAALTCALKAQLVAQEKAWDDRLKADEACEPFVQQASELNQAGKIKEALKLLTDCNAKLPKSCRCAQAWFHQAAPVGMIDNKAPMMLKFQRCDEEAQARNLRINPPPGPPPGTPDLPPAYPEFLKKMGVSAPLPKTKM